MKHRTRRALIFWILLAAVGLVAVILNFLLSWPRWIGWLVSLTFWGTDCIWIGLHFLLIPAGKKKSGASFTGNQGVFERVNRECNEAVGRYLGSVRRKGIFKKSALYERPWILLCGPSQSGKTSLIKGCGIDFPVRYPSEKDGLMIDGNPQSSWYFGNTGVWIDTPGSFMTDGSPDEWRATVASLARVRPLNPVDGVAVVVSGPEIVSSDAASVKQRATQLRRRIDDLIASWGIEFPVYLVFSRMDEVPGFNEFFGPVAGKNDQVFGATIGDDGRKMLPRQVFNREFHLLCESMSERRLESLSAVRDGAHKRMMCRFVIHFESQQDKLADFVTELFKPSNYEGRPIFHGFYFTSCQKSADDDSASSSVSPQYDISNTIANHPLNPRRMTSGQAEAADPAVKKSPAISSYFVTPLFSSVMTGSGSSMVKHTQKRSRREMIRHYSLAAAILFAAGIISWYLMSSLGANRRLLDGSRLALSKSASIRSYADAYRRFGGIGSVTATLQGYKDNGVPPVIGGGIYRGGKVLEELRPEFIALSQKLILKPAVKYLEYSINGLCDQTGELSGEQHLALYRALKACLSLSEAVAQRTELIDTVFLRDALVEAVTQSLLRAEGQSRLPVDIEAVLHQNLGLMLAYHKRGGFPLIQENQSMVTYARRRLQRLPDATTLYELVAGRITKDAPRIKLSDIIGSADETILQSELTISAIYTKEGWERYVRDAIAEAAKDPFKVDWVIGVNPDAVSAALPEPTKLRADMNEAYFTDYTRRWLAFINAVTMEPFGDLGRSGRILKKLTSDQSELVLLLKTVSDYTAIDISSGTADAGEKALAAASKLKATSALAKKAGKMQNTADIIGDNFGLPHRSGGDYLKRTFDPLRSFIQSTGGALGGYEGYRDKIQTLAEKLADIEERGDDHAVIVFNGGDSDPLLSSWKLTQNVISGMPEDLGEACGNLLLLPLRHTGISASAVLTEKLNARWQEEVVKQFTSRFASNFPIKSSVSEEASFNDVMEFFRPNTGTLWGFYDRVLEPFIIKSGGNWTVITVGSLDINFNPEITKSLENADRIREIFYKTDGTVRTLSITLTPLPRNKFRAAIEVNGQTAELKPGGASAQIRWPVDAPSQGAVLKAFVSDDFTQELSFKGRWGLMRLIQKAKISVLNKSTFDATWEMNVQNMYMAYLTVRIQVSGNDHPFGEPVFSQFDCPVNLTIHGVPKVEPQE